MKYLLFLCMSLFICSCASGQKEKQSEAPELSPETAEEDYDFMSQMEQDFVGVWTNLSMRVHVNSYNNSDTSFLVDINEDTWEMKMSIKPIVTTVYENGTYISEFRNSFDSLIYNPKGTWMIDGDSLIMEDHQEVYKYQIFIDGDIAEFRSLVDWDKDGIKDDAYFGIQRKQ